MKAEKRAVLAQSSFRRFRTIGRMPDRAGKRSFTAPARRKKPSERIKKNCACTANESRKESEKRAVLAQRLEENYDRNLLRQVI